MDTSFIHIFEIAPSNCRFTNRSALVVVNFLYQVFTAALLPVNANHDELPFANIRTPTKVANPFELIVYAGDIPIKFHWFRFNLPVKPAGAIKSTAAGKDMLSLCLADRYRGEPSSDIPIECRYSPSPHDTSSVLVNVVGLNHIAMAQFGPIVLASSGMAV